MTTGGNGTRIVAGRTLRDYQTEAVEAMERAGTGAHLVVMATGLGKTVCMAGVRRTGRTLILSHRDELVHQAARYYDVPVGFEQGPEHAGDETIVSASVQTLARPQRLHRFTPGEFDLVFTDEAHHATAPTYRRIIDWLKPARHIGLTATPRRGDGRGLRDVYEDIIYQRDLRWGIANGWLTDIDARRVTVAWDTTLVRRAGGDYDRRLLAREVDTARTNEQVAAAVGSLARGQTLVFASGVDHAHALAALIPSSHAIDGTTPSTTRARLLRRFANREFRCLINYGIFTEGTDLPLIETIVIARPTQNNTLYTQMVGRGLRPAPGKTSLRLIDCVGASDDKRLCTPPTLFGIDESRLPAPARTPDVLDGSLMGLAARVESACDNPVGWVLRTRGIDVLGSRLTIAWVTLPDGTRTIQGADWSATLAPPDLVDRVRATVTLPSRRPLTAVFDDERQADEAVHRLLLTDTGTVAAARLWERDKVRRWGRQPATEAQMRLVRQLVDRDGWDADLGTISKYEAHCIIETGRREQQGIWGACPACGEPLRPSANGRTIQCSTNRRTRDGDGWTLTAGCGTWLPASIDGVRLDPAQVRDLAAGRTIRIDGEEWAITPDGHGGWRTLLISPEHDDTGDDPR